VQERPVTLMLGDVALVHDLTGLALATSATHVPLVVVVVNNRGGRIFDTLPLASSDVAADVLRHVVTPHDVRFEHAAAMFGHRYALATTTAELRKALDDAYTASGCTLVEAQVPEHGGADLHRRVFASVDAAVGNLAAG
jgi:2-succinyl-5-enolpyruvyl-6-hydroxy-3-cyclohexene-1-carboxylate synthase